MAPQLTGVLFVTARHAPVPAPVPAPGATVPQS